MTLAFPIALVGLLAVPALVAIYWLRSKHRRHVVSSLLLWADEGRPREGGIVFDRLQTPLTFFLELIAITLLVFAAAGPSITARAANGTLVAVLDDSFSMLAGGDDSPRSRGKAAIKTELARGRYDHATLILAGESPAVLGETGAGDSQVVRLLDQWRCPAPGADIQGALGLAFTIAGDRGRVLVVTDHGPTEPPTNNRLEWLAFGRARSNVAIINATRTERDNGERCMIEVANLSSASATSRLIVEQYSDNPDAESRELAHYDLTLGPDSSNRVVFNLKPGAAALRARIADDALAVDNRCVLMPQPHKQAAVAVRISDEKLKQSLEKALQATGIATVTGGEPDLLFTDDQQVNPLPEEQAKDTWVVQFLVESSAESFVGPFVIDRGHPLTDGLSLAGVVWAAARTQPAGRAIITAGDVPLLTDTERGGVHQLRWHIKPDISTLQDSPAWPVLVWNIADWRVSHLPGLRETNIHLGSSVTLALAPGVKDVQVKAPGESPISLPAGDRSLSISADTSGVYEVIAGRDHFNFAANALSRQESDLTHCDSGSWNGWDGDTQELQQRSIAWIFALLAMVILALHLAIVARSGSRAVARG
jgi:hypothetical protein